MLMNIVSLKSSPGQQDFILKEESKAVLKFRYKNDLHIARLETENEKRVLQIDDEGLLKTKLVLKNEYGVRIGSLNYDNFSDTHGTVDIENTKYRFDIQQGEKPQLDIYKGSRRNHVYSCQLAFDNNSKEARRRSSSLIMAVSWYLFLKNSMAMPVFNEAIIL